MCPLRSLVLLAEATDDPQQARRLYEEGVEAGIRALGPEPFAVARLACAQ